MANTGSVAGVMLTAASKWNPPRNKPSPTNTFCDTAGNVCHVYSKTARMLRCRSGTSCRGVWSKSKLVRIWRAMVAQSISRTQPAAISRASGIPCTSWTMSATAACASAFSANWGDICCAAWLNKRTASASSANPSMAMRHSARSWSGSREVTSNLTPSAAVSSSPSHRAPPASKCSKLSSTSHAGRWRKWANNCWGTGKRLSRARCKLSAMAVGMRSGLATAAKGTK